MVHIICGSAFPFVKGSVFIYSSGFKDIQRITTLWLQRLGGRMFYNIGNGSVAAQDPSLLRRRLEEQQQAELFLQAIDLQRKRFQLLDLKTCSFVPTTVPATTTNAQIASSTVALAEMTSACNGISSPVVSQDDDRSSSIGCSSEMQQQPPVNNNAGNKVESAEEPSSKDNMKISQFGELLPITNKCFVNLIEW